ncbi:MAG: hypothetical protein NTX41_03515 [Verrucomicrobia bacterium]|nr:hypothetical protein [Verrucomicrobiota bacterium]
MRRFLLTVALLSFASLAQAIAPNDIQFKLMIDTRTQFQGRFAKAQQALGLDPTKAPAEAHANLEAFSKEIAKLKDDAVALQEARYQYWNNQSYWRNFWDKGPAAKFVVAKLRAQIDAAIALQVPVAAPFTKPDLNTMQKSLDAIRACFELDKQLQLMEVQLNNLPKR